MASIRLKRVYEEPSPDDGLRILVERLWPRGLSKRRAAVDEWMKDIAPSPELRRWFGHDPAKWEEFRGRYWAELERNQDAVAELRRKIREGTVTLVYAARDEQHNAALALWEYLALPLRSANVGRKEPLDLEKPGVSHFKAEESS
jgi:uncharacterized protein YeaO (DUF488 family)